ncbi:carboxylating nicotinate-nucleotide diphosphorylase [bacterium]|nr:carboxylating nicotinate-nucleotide diphosphorylase [bacterium]
MLKAADPIIESELSADLGSEGDLTSLFTIPEGLKGTGEFLSKGEGRLAGLDIAGRVFSRVDDAVKFDLCIRDGQAVTRGSVIGTVEGPVHSLLAAERTALNFIQRLSGIATRTALFVEAVRGTNAVILDTRKTTPGWRVLEKYAVRQGGGRNHRMGLYDAVMIKDNHVDACGGTGKAIARCLGNMKKNGKSLFIEVETRDLDEVREASGYPIQRIMLDNMDTDTMREAVRIIGGRMETEASGNVTLANVRSIAQTGVNFISVGALTHSVPVLDISFDIRIAR